MYPVSTRERIVRPMQQWFSPCVFIIWWHHRDVIVFNGITNQRFFISTSSYMQSIRKKWDSHMRQTLCFKTRIGFTYWCRKTNDDWMRLFIAKNKWIRPAVRVGSLRTTKVAMHVNDDGSPWRELSNANAPLINELSLNKLQLVTYTKSNFPN